MKAVTAHGHRLLVMLVSLFIATALQAQALRPMHIHEVKALGLEIWTEYEPEWSTDLVHQGKKALFIVQSPPLVYPPAAMSYVSFPEMKVIRGEMREVAASAIRQAARNYRVAKSDREQITLQPAEYGDLKGYEATFSGLAQGDPVDIKVFVGHAEGKPTVAMQAYTLRGKLPHISEQIRRAWSNIKYLEP